MKKKTNRILLVGLLLALALAACGQADASTNTASDADLADIPVVQADLAVIAEGRIVPVQYVSLAFPSGGQIAEVLVSEGEEVAAGQPLARLRNGQLQSAVAATEMEVLQAQQALDDLNDNLELLTAQAQQAVAVAQDAVRDAERRVTNLAAGAYQVNVDSAQANVVLLQDRLEKEQDNFEKYADKPEGNLTRAAFQSRLADAQLAYDAAVRQLNALTGAANEVDLAVAEAELAVSTAQLRIAERDHALWQQGPHPDQLAAAESRLNSAQTALAAAQSALADTELRATFAGTVVDFTLKVGEQVGPGQIAAVVADISQWVVETDNLTEIEVPQISVGQRVSVQPDALPELTLNGTVAVIGDLFEEKRGDVTYTVQITLDDVSDALRWGMTVVVEFEKP